MIGALAVRFPVLTVCMSIRPWKVASEHQRVCTWVCVCGGVRACVHAWERLISTLLGNERAKYEKWSKVCGECVLHGYGFWYIRH